MSKLKIGIVEDESIIADSICTTLMQLGYIVTEPVGSYTEALAMIEREAPDLLLLDIQLSGAKDGIDLAWKIKETYKIPFIFLTANSDPATVERAKMVCPPAYLVKPFSKDDLYAAIEICIYNSEKQNLTVEDAKYILRDTLFIKESNCFHKVLFRDVLYLESDHVYVKIHTSVRAFLVRASMQDYIQRFDPALFHRVHRSYVINVGQVDSIKELQVLIKGHEVPISRVFREKLLSKLKLG
jgi:two-component system response regulator LytT